MPKEVSAKYYAVINSRDGSKIYTNLHEYLNATTYHIAASGKSFNTYQDAQRWLDSRTLTPKVGSPGPSLVSPGSTPRSPRSSSYPSNSRHDNLQKSSRYVDIGIQCESLHSHDVHPPNVPVTTLSTKLVPVRPRAKEVHGMQVGVKLSGEQLAVLNMVDTGYNVFFTGPAGTGKSVLLREIIYHLRNSKKCCVAVTAPTGIAGINIGGSTIHSWAGIGLGKEKVEVLAERITASKKLRKRWLDTNVLVIDEISMLDGILFDKLENIGRVVRDNERPFGGIQLILCGDFFQLPPVPDKSHNHQMPSTFAFDAESWPKCISRPVFLNQVFRQKDDTFVSLLTSIRHGNLTSQHIHILDSLVRPLHYDDGIEPTQLFPRRNQVEECNNEHLNDLEGDAMTYNSMDSAGWDVYREPISKAAAETLLDRLIAPSTIALKVGAQVMLIVNIEPGALVNGSIGKVIEFLTHREATERSIRIVDPNSRSGDTGGEPEDKVPKVLSEFRSFDDSRVFEKHEKWPLVQFPNGSTLLCSAMPFSVQGFMGNVEALRIQVPLILAWALSIHKSQGQTLSRVKVDLSRAFESGQAYVALSRATSLEGLELTKFDPSTIRPHVRVVAWHSECIAKKQSMSIEEEMDSEEAISQFWNNTP